MHELALEGVSHSFLSAGRMSKHLVLDRVSLTIRDGECVLLRGANGAGKSTLLRIAAGLLRPERGEVRVGGRSVVGWRNRGGQIGFLPQSNALYLDLTANENFSLARSLAQSGGGGRLNELVARLGLQHVLTKRVRDCSQGMQRRIAFCRMLLHRPRVLLLDEPFAHIDEAGRAAMIELLADSQREGGCCLLVEHQVGELSALAPTSVALHDGLLRSSEGER